MAARDPERQFQHRPDDTPEDAPTNAAGNEEQPDAWAPGTPRADAELGTGVMGRGEDVLTKSETHALASDPGLPIEERDRDLPRRR